MKLAHMQSAYALAAQLGLLNQALAEAGDTDGGLVEAAMNLPPEACRVLADLYEQARTFCNIMDGKGNKE